MNWYKECFKHYADFKGRARRREYWWFALINFIIAFVLLLVLMTSAVMPVIINDPEFLETAGSADFELVSGFESEIYDQMIHSPVFYIYVVFELIMLVPGLSVMVRRLHDTGRSGWWAFMPFVAGLLPDAMKVISVPLGVRFIVSLAAFAAFVVFIVWMFLDSQPGANQWGSNPKEPDWNSGAPADGEPNPYQ